METVSLAVQTREKGMKTKNLLRDGILPLQYYGKGVESRSFGVDYQTFRKVFRHAGQNTVIELDVDGKEKISVLVHEIQYDPVQNTFQHVDLINVRMDQEVTTVVPLEFVGEAPAVKNLAGVLTPNLNEIEIRCLPNDLIHKVEVDISSLEDFHVSIRVSDLKVPETIAVLNDPDELVINVSAPRVEEEVEEVAAEGEEGAEGEAAEGGEEAEEKSQDEGGE